MKRLDPLIILILSAVALAIIWPARGGWAEALATATNIGIALLFFLYGARLSGQEALAGLKNWKLHLLILAFTFAVYPLVGLALNPLKLVFGPELYLGILYLTLVPSTVQSSVAFTSIARGNVAGAIVSASLSNLAGVVLTPLLVMALMGAGDGITVDGSVFMKLCFLLLLPFLLGQLTRRWVGTFAASKATKIVDRGSIALVVYSAFSEGVVGGIWSTVSVGQIIALIALSAVLVFAMLWLARTTGRLLGLDRADQKAVEFCGSKKSLATGLPMATVIFGASGAGIALLVLPLMIFHQVQLMICSWLAGKYSRQS